MEVTWVEGNLVTVTSSTKTHYSKGSGTRRYTRYSRDVSSSKLYLEFVVEGTTTVCDWTPTCARQLATIARCCLCAKLISVFLCACNYEILSLGSSEVGAGVACAWHFSHRICGPCQGYPASQSSLERDSMLQQGKELAGFGLNWARLALCDIL